MKRLVIAGTSSMVGKTTVSTGIMAALSKKLNVQPYKIGPDYIDPTYHTTATENHSRNLDSFFMNNFQIKKLFAKNSKKADISVIEGVRGLYEGLSPYNDIGSTASVAKSLKSPVILLMDARSLTRSAAAIIKGFKSFDSDVDIQGVIFNKVRGEKHYSKLKDAVEYYDKDIKIIGAIPRSEELTVSQRHLGLVPTPEKKNEMTSQIELWAETIENSLDLDLLKELSDADFDTNLNVENIKNIKNLENIENIEKIGTNECCNLENGLWDVNKNNCKVAIAHDEAFNFYYWDNIDALEDNGAKIKFFSPLHDEEVPDSDMIYIGGGYPEIFAKELSHNKKMLNSIRQRVENKESKIYAECGGLMYASRYVDGYESLGLLDCEAVTTKNVQGLSYVKGEFTENCPIGKSGFKFRAHEFHYSKLVNIGENSKFAYKINRGVGIANNLDGLLNDDKTVLGGYAHQHCVGNPYFASSLVNYI
ncbi:cobyrinic acid a,c-diamide synthase [Methanococcus voltae]|uniref:Cobyrinate a,c-diamide synthase n=1 Tax=Methanococcus voltae TaxID=2188 RepID=A0A8J7S1K4_METVO|nr:Ni-sirohydrochlorin a,c-diamide synthase [Methanococcus voltae]MBP2201695.1 cobyrinic acid a,c-diamide synthase [Methanococcus voltae]